MNQPNPYAAPSSVVDEKFSGEEILWGENLASRLSRAIAAFLDWISYSIATTPGFVLLILADSRDWSFSDVRMLAGFLMLGGFIALAGYNVYRLHTEGQTLGKQLMKIRIVRSDLHTRASIWRIVGFRVMPMVLIYFIPVFGALIVLANPFFIFGASRQCLHDMIADTSVVRVGDSTQPPPRDMSW